MSKMPKVSKMSRMCKDSLIATRGCPITSFRNPSQADIRNPAISIAYLDTGSRLRLVRYDDFDGFWAS